jgi:phosphoribosylformylglycinamidine (FGAM) synthase-like enzyme
VAIDGNPELADSDPYLAAAATVAEAARNLVCVGARPLALTDCLNLGNPERPRGAWELRRTIEGLAAAARALRLPFVSGNVSLYNANAGSDILPTAVVGAVGRVNDVSRAIRPGLGAEGDALVLCGGVDFDLLAEARLHAFVLDCHERGLIAAAHDVGEGGLAVALAEMAIAAGRGAWVRLGDDPFARAHGRIVMAVSDRAPVLDLARSAGVPCQHVGTVGGEQLRIDGVLEVSVAECAAAHRGGLAGALGLA